MANTYNIFFIHSSVSGHLDWFYVLAIINCTIGNIGVTVSFRIMFFFLVICPGVRLLDHMVALLIVF